MRAKVIVLDVGAQHLTSAEISGNCFVTLPVKKLSGARPTTNDDKRLMLILFFGNFSLFQTRQQRIVKYLTFSFAALHQPWIDAFDFSTAKIARYQ
jgi:hypothetical protein